MRYVFPLLISNAVFLSVLPLQAADIAEGEKINEFSYRGPDFYFLGGIGYTSLRADEFVYDEQGAKISQLIWKSSAPALKMAAKFVSDNAFTISANLLAAMSGDSYMEEYDWGETLPAGYPPDAWSDLSVHPDTQLIRYWTVDIAFGRNVPLTEASVINLHGGFKYTNVKWTAYGGSYVYSSYSGFRDVSGDFNAGEPAISYEQSYPALFLGAEIATQLSGWMLSAFARGGISIAPRDDDHHWMRDIYFIETYGQTPFISLGVRAEYALNSRLFMFLAGNFDQYFHKTGDTEIFDIKSGKSLVVYPDAAGMKLQSLAISAGFQYRF